MERNNETLTIGTKARGFCIQDTDQVNNVNSSTYNYWNFHIGLTQILYQGSLSLKSDRCGRLERCSIDIRYGSEVSDCQCGLMEYYFPKDFINKQ